MLSVVTTSAVFSPGLRYALEQTLQTCCLSFLWLLSCRRNLDIVRNDQWQPARTTNKLTRFIKVKENGLTFWFGVLFVTFELTREWFSAGVNERMRFQLARFLERSATTWKTRISCRVYDLPRTLAWPDKKIGLTQSQTTWFLADYDVFD